MFKPWLLSLLSLYCSCSYAQTPIMLQGHLEQGGLVIGKTKPGNKVLLDDKALDVSASGEYAFGFGRDDSDNHQLVIIDDQGEKVTRNLKPRKRNYKIQRINGIPKKIMQPDAKAVARSKLDNQQVSSARAINSELGYFALGFRAPSPGKVTGVYGSQRVFNGEPKRPHFGVDFAGKIGDPVRAPAAGIVRLFVPDMFYSGGTMIIDHGHGINSTFLHLSKAYVKQGDEVKQGQVVAAVGASGRATGPHLDWRLNWFNVRLDPALALTSPVIP